MDETAEFLTALLSRGPDEPTACPKWRVRDLVAHMAAGAQEESDLIEAALDGQAARPTRTFEEREAAYRALAYEDLLSALAREGSRLSGAIDRLEATGGRVAFTGMTLDAAAFRTHTRSELALHRWDLIGDDEVGDELLAQPDLTAHTAAVLTQMSGLQESIARRAAGVAGLPETFALRSPGHHDVLIRTRPGPAIEITHAEPDVPVIRCDASTRLLVLWGRATDRADFTALPEKTTDPIKAFLHVGRQDHDHDEQRPRIGQEIRNVTG